MMIDENFRKTFRSGAANIDDSVNFLLSLHTGWKLLQKLLDDIKFPLEERVFIILIYGKRALKLLEDQVINCSFGDQVN